MIFFSDIDFPSCVDCEYAIEYIPYFTFPYADPCCSKGHGQCSVDKFCEDFRLINSHFCYECEHQENSFCNKKHETIDKNSISCVYFVCKEEFL